MKDCESRFNFKLLRKSFVACNMSVPYPNQELMTISTAIAKIQQRKIESILQCTIQQYYNDKAKFCLFPCFRRCFCTVDVMMGLLNLCFYLLCYVILLSLFTRITSALFIYDKRTLLDIGHRCTNLLQDTLSTDPAWPLETLRNSEVNKGHLNNRRRRKKHRGRRAGIRN